MTLNSHFNCIKMFSVFAKIAKFGSTNCAYTWFLYCYEKNSYKINNRHEINNRMSTSDACISGKYLSNIHT